MNQSKFMSEVFKDSETVTVNANELQAILRKLTSTEYELETIKRKFKSIQDANKLLHSELLAVHCEAPLTVKLDVKV